MRRTGGTGLRGSPRGRCGSGSNDVPKKPSISKAEMAIARIVWQLKSASARQVHESLPRTRKIDFTTVQTYLTRLEEKGYIKSRKEGRARVFSAKVQPQRVMREAVHELMELLFDGDAVPMVRHLIEDADMTTEEIDELRKMLDELS